MTENEGVPAVRSCYCGLEFCSLVSLTGFWNKCQAKSIFRMSMNQCSSVGLMMAATDLGWCLKGEKAMARFRFIGSLDRKF